MILTPLQKLNNNLVDLGKIIVAPGFEWLPKVQKITQSGHTGCDTVGWVVVSHTRGLRFESSHCQFLLSALLINKTEIKNLLEIDNF